MSQARVNVRIGKVRFSGKGDAVWLEAQLDKVLSAARDMAAEANDPTIFELGTTIIDSLPTGLRHLWESERSTLGAAKRWLLVKSRRMGDE